MNELPEVFKQTEPKEGVSNRYELINTSLIVEALVDKGFSIDSYSMAGYRVPENADKQKHLITMKYNQLETKEGVPTIVIQNSHNRSSGLKLYSGYIRFACLNGLIAGTNMDSITIRHSEGWVEKVNDFIASYQANVKRMEDEHQRMKSKIIRGIPLRTILNESAKLRYDINDVMDVNELNLIRRVEDRGNTGWEVYNRIQEALIKGHFTRRTHRTNDDGLKIDNWSKAKEIKDTSEIIRINRQLRDIILEEV